MYLNPRVCRIVLCADCRRDRTATATDRGGRRLRDNRRTRRPDAVQTIGGRRNRIAGRLDEKGASDDGRLSHTRRCRGRRRLLLRRHGCAGVLDGRRSGRRGRRQADGNVVVASPGQFFRASGRR